MLEDVQSTTLAVRVSGSWLAPEIIESLPTAVRAFAARFPATGDMRFQVDDTVVLTIATAENAIEVIAEGGVAGNWMLHNVLTDIVRLLIARLRAFGEGRSITIDLRLGPSVLAVTSVTLDENAVHLVLAGPTEDADVELGTRGNAELETTWESASDRTINIPTVEHSPAAPMPPEPCITVPLHYATDRTPMGAADGSTNGFGVERGGLGFGVVDVKVPRDRERGALQRRKKWYQLIRFDEDARTHIHRVTELSEAAFYASLTNAVAAKSRKRVLVFVHGYNVSFAAAAERAAQLHVDLEFDGVPLLYSWPSAAAWDKYFRDSATIDASRHTFAAILRRVVAEVQAEEVHILAHSMGSRAVARALEQLALEVNVQPLVAQLIFAAPDVDANEMENMLPRLAKVAKRVTIYGSSKDWPMTFSAFLAGWRRAGEGGANLLVVEHAESIDASDIDTAFLAHSYVAENGTLLRDINALLERDEPAKGRFGVSKRVGGGYALESSYRP